MIGNGTDRKPQHAFLCEAGLLMLQGFPVFRTDVRLGSSKETDYKRETEPTTFACTHFVTTDFR
jgi:hypothetical protein